MGLFRRKGVKGTEGDRTDVYTESATGGHTHSFVDHKTGEAGSIDSPKSVENVDDWNERAECAKRIDR